MERLKELFGELVSNSNICDLNPQVELLDNKTQIGVSVEYSVPLEGRPNRRSSIVRFLYSDEFIEENKDIVSMSPKDNILEIINTFDFAATEHKHCEPRPVYTFVILANGEIQQRP